MPDLPALFEEFLFLPVRDEASPLQFSTTSAHLRKKEKKPLFSEYDTDRGKKRWPLT